MSPDDTPLARTKDHENQHQQGGSGGGNSKKTGSTTRPQEQGMKCPRCDSPNTKFCYYNNYSLTQPRHFCKTCRRYWTKGGALRNVPIGGGCRKNKKVKSSRLSSCDSRDSGGSSSELGGLKFLHGLAAAPSLDFHLGGLPFPRLHHHPNTAMFNNNNQFPSSFGDLSATSSASNNNSCFNIDPSCGTTPSSLIGLNYPFSSNSAGTAGGLFSGGGGGANATIQGMSSMNINSSLASSIESLSSMNQDLHWKLQQQRLSNMLFGGGDSSDQKDHGGVVSSLVEKPQPILFQNLEVSSKPHEIFSTRKGGPSEDNTTTTVTPTEWFFGNNSYASVAPTLANNSNDGGGGGGGHGHDNGTSNWGGGGVHAWGDVQQHQYSALP